MLDWYEGRRLAYPWRRTRDPYRVLVSEIMLQQTQASRVVPVFERFVLRFGTLRALAAAPRPAVIDAWAGLGYNRRAVSLSAAVRRIAADHDAIVPRDPVALRSLPGIGPYTSAAVASIAFGAPLAAIDTNVRRVVARALIGTEDADDAEVDTLAGRWLERERPGDWNQAVMDVGRLFCRPIPRCEGCPLGGQCAFRRSGAAPRRVGRLQPPFAGSMRQVRGDVVRILRAASPCTISRLLSETGHGSERLTTAIAGLASDGVVEATPAALGGSLRGRVSLAR